jgi:hypothetical protein
MMKTGALLSAAIAFTAVMAAPAYAATPFLDFNGSAGGFGHFDMAAGDFTDTFHFTVPSDGTAGGTISSIKVRGAPDVNFTSVQLNGTDFDIGSTGNVEFRFLEELAVLAGEQTLVVKGNSQLGGYYDGTLSYAAVPEPATWAMMIAGFGLTGAAMRRRKTRVAVTYA